MDGKRIGGYVVSLPERVLRSFTGLAAGAARELGEVVLPSRVRSSKLYQSMVESTLRFLIEQVAEIEGAYGDQFPTMPPDFLVRRTAGNVFEIAGITAFHASPVWVLAALADLAGVGRDLIGEIAEGLQQEGLLEKGRRFHNVDQLLDGLEHTAATLAETVNTPPLDVAALRVEWSKIRAGAARFQGVGLPGADRLVRQWTELKTTASAQKRSVLEVSSLMALAAIRALPDSTVWLSRSIRSGGRRTGQVVARGLLDHYQTTLGEIRETGYMRYWLREYAPYLKGAVQQFSVHRESWIERCWKRRRT